MHVFHPNAPVDPTDIPSIPGQPRKHCQLLISVPFPQLSRDASVVQGLQIAKMVFVSFCDGLFAFAPESAGIHSQRCSCRDVALFALLARRVRTTLALFRLRFRQLCNELCVPLSCGRWRTVTFNCERCYVVCTGMLVFLGG